MFEKPSAMSEQNTPTLSDADYILINLGVNDIYGPSRGKFKHRMPRKLKKKIKKAMGILTPNQ